MPAASPGRPLGVLTAPLGDVDRGRLRFAGGASQVALGADPGLPGLFRASFEGPAPPSVTVDGGMVTVDVREASAPSVPGPGWRAPKLSITLTGAIPWGIEFLRAAVNVTADLAGLRLESLEVRGAACGLEVRLPPPAGEVAVRLLGDASDLTISRPPGVAVRIRAHHGARYLAMDDRYTDAAGGHELWQSPDYTTARDRYDLTISGTAHAVTVSTDHRAR